MPEIQEWARPQKTTSRINSRKHAEAIMFAGTAFLFFALTALMYAYTNVTQDLLVIIFCVFISIGALIVLGISQIGPAINHGTRRETPYHALLSYSKVTAVLILLISVIISINA